jgi:hypothetical protein
LVLVGYVEARGCANTAVTRDGGDIDPDQD